MNKEELREILKMMPRSIYLQERPQSDQEQWFEERLARSRARMSRFLEQKIAETQGPDGQLFKVEWFR